MRDQVHHNANQYIPQLRLSATDGSSATAASKGRLSPVINAPFHRRSARVSKVFARRCALNADGKMRTPGRRLCRLLSLSPHRVFLNRGVPRLLLPVAAAGGAALPDADADPGAMGRPGSGGTIRSCKVPHALRLEVRQSSPRCDAMYFPPESPCKPF